MSRLLRISMLWVVASLAYGETAPPYPTMPPYPTSSPNPQYPVQSPTASPVVSNPPVSTNPSSYGALVGGVMQNAQNIQGSAPVLNVPQMNASDRKDNSNEIGNQATEAGNAANAAGTAMLSAGIPMAASPIPSVMAAGITLIGMAGMEFGQGGAMNNAAQSYYGGANTLSQNGIPSNQTQATPIPPAVASQLSNLGVNPNDFIAGMQNGTITDPAAALGFTAPTLTAEEQAEANSLVANAMGTESLQEVSYDETSDTTAAIGSSGAGGANSIPTVTAGKSTGALDARGLASVGSGAASGAGSTSGHNNNLSRGKGGAAGADGAGGANATAAGANNPLDALMAKLGVTKDAKNFEQQKAAMRQNLERQGILIMPQGHNLFQRASRAYRSFSRWRKQVAMVDVRRP